MARRTWRVLVIDDNPQMTADAERELREAFAGDPDIDLQIQTENSFSEGFERVKRGECEITVLDVRRDKTDTAPEERDTGRRVFADIREVRFLPVIFWTALPQEVSDQKMPPLVDVFPKDALALLPDAIRAAINSGAADVMTAIEENVAAVMRDHMWKELAPNWAEDTQGGQPQELAHILITRVAHALQDQALPELTARPSHCYLYPPVSVKYRPGDLLRGGSSDAPVWRVVLTPACDLEHEGKATFALIGRAAPLTIQPKYTTWAAAPSKNTWKPLNEMLVGNIARYAYLPQYREIPDLILDLEDTTSIPIAELDGYVRVASLVAPYSEALLIKHSNFRGRIGTPDLNSTSVRERLTAALAPISS